MAAKAITIEISYSLTKICEVDYKAKTHKIYKSFTVSNGAEVINDGALMVSPEYVENLRRALAANHVKTKQVVFTITSSKIASREVTIPFVKENRIADVVNANATDYFPVDLSQYQLAYTILGTIGETKGAQQYKLLVMAVPAALLTGYYELAKALKLEVAAIDYAGNSIFQVVKDECANGKHIVVKIDERSSLVMAVENSVLTFTRSVAYGVEEVLETVMNTLCWGEVSSVEQAIRVLQRNECIASEEGGGSESAEASAMSAKDRAMEDVREAIMPLISGITRVIDYYASRGAGGSIERILITGVGADFKGMGELLSRETNMPVAVLREAAGWN
ncbi:MAG: pilus assembly protein PilM, partial [Lachnospiraceae bacterium]|nr:pilus assembly protein PilM [Lachnospiraceae bacterium]